MIYYATSCYITDSCVDFDDSGCAGQHYQSKGNVPFRMCGAAGKDDFLPGRISYCPRMSTGRAGKRTSCGFLRKSKKGCGNTRVTSKKVSKSQ